MERTITIPAKVGTRDGVICEPVGHCTIFFCISTTAQCSVKASRQELRTVRTSSTFGSPESQPFNLLTFYNSSSSAIVLTYYAGDEPYSGQSTEITGVVVGEMMDASTYSKSHTTTTLAAGDVWSFMGLDGAHQRKQISVSNGDATNRIEVLDGNNRTGQFVQPGTTWTHITNGIIKVKNPTAGDLEIAVLETFYT